MTNETNPSHQPQTETTEQAAARLAAINDREVSKGFGNWVRRNPRKSAGIGGGLVLAVAGGIVAANIARGPGDGPTPGQTTTSEPSEEPTASPEPTETEAPVAEFDPSVGLSVESLPASNPEALSQAGVVYENAWINAGATKENGGADYNTGVPAFALYIAEQNNPGFENGLLPADWRSRPDLVNFVEGNEDNDYDGIEGTNVSTLELFLATYDTDRDAEPYMRGFKFLSVVSSTPNPDGSLTIVSQEQQFDNSDKNRANELSGNVLNTSPYTVSKTWKPGPNGKWELVGYDFQSYNE